MNKLFKYIESRPALNMSELAKGIGVSPQYLNDVLKGSRSLSVNFAFKLASELTKYGLIIDSWIFEEYDEEYPLSLFAMKWKDSEEGIQSIDKGDHFEYTRTFYREMWEPIEFYEFIEESVNKYPNN